MMGKHLNTVTELMERDLKNVYNWVPILEKCYENSIVVCRQSTFHVMKSYPCYRIWYS